MDKLQGFLLLAPVVLFSMVAHEYAHGYAALKQGDPTAYQLGRLTWNPVKHIDPFMTILLPLLTYYGSGGGFMFGGAKPVPVVPRNYRDYKRGDIIVSLAGIVVNLLLVAVCAVVIVGLGLLGRGIAPAADTLALVQRMMVWGILFNLILAFFNLIPIPPLDGSHVMKYLLPPSWALRYQQFGRYGIILLIILIATNVGRPFFAAWMKPVAFLFEFARGAVASYMLESSYGFGI